MFKKGNKGYWLGKKRDKKTKEKIRLAHLGKRDDETNHWLGDKVGYDGLHDWVYRKLGSPMICEECSKICKNNYQIHWANKSGEYKRDIDDWLRLCVKCHYERDQKNIIRERNNVGQFI